MPEELTLSKLLFNEPEVLEIPPFGKIKVRLPTNGQRLKAYSLAKKKEYWNDLPDEERDAEFARNLIPFILEEPKITHEDLEKIPAPHLNAIVEMILAWLLKKDEELRKERQNVFDSFFQVAKEKQA